MSVDHILMRAVNEAFKGLFERDNPARVAPPEHVEYERSDLAWKTDGEIRRTLDHWLSTKPNSDDILSDLFQDTDLFAKLLLNFRAGDDAENGRLIRNRFMTLCDACEDDARYWEDES